VITGRLFKFNPLAAVAAGLAFTFVTERLKVAMVLLMICVWMFATSNAQGSADESNLVVDNDSSATTATGTWQVSAGADPYGANSLYSAQAGDTYTFSIDLPQSGNYEVFLWWTTYSNRRTDVPVDITHTGGTATVSVDQQHDGGQWNSLGTWAFNDLATITIHSLGDGTTCADAVKLVPVTDASFAPKDNGDAATTATGTWKVSSGADPYGANSLYSTQAGDTYTFSIDLPQSGNYEVFLWWTTYSNRRTDVPVDITHAGGTATVSVDQQHDGGQWNSLGTWAFNDLATITIHSLGDGTTCADAVKLVPKGGDTNSPIITLLGANPMTIELGHSYIDPGVTAADDIDGDLTAFIVIDDTGVNTASVGDYTVNYTVSDSDGNTAHATRTVKVVDLSLPPPPSPQEVLAFPGAVGYGRNAKGGRGGVVCEVTNLNDSGAGSFRSCVEKSGPRTVVFRVGGTITLKSMLHITNPFITIAGQTAPGDGITIRTDGLGLVPDVWTPATIFVNTHDVVLRFIRLRPAATLDEASIEALGIQQGGTYDVIVDHCSVSWGSNEVIGVSGGSKDVTIQNSILSEALKPNGHKGSISCCGSSNVTYYENLFAHNYGRSPMVKAYNDGPATFQVINNVIYDWGAFATYLGQYEGYDSDLTRVDAIGNYYKPGPSNSGHYEIYISHPEVKAYVEGNIGPHRPNDSLDGWASVGYINDPVPQTPQRVFTRLTPDTFPVLSAFSAYNQVLASVGATKPKRDGIDKRIVNDVINGTGRSIDKPSDVGGWRNLKGGKAPVDSDHDGMPDAWELAQDLDPHNAADRNKLSPSGYTWLETYLHYLVVE
jgi:pectate lyase